MSVNTDAPIAGGSVLATTTELSSRRFIVTWPAGTTIPAGAPSGGQVLGGYRMQFLAGNRESATAPGNTIGSAGFENLTPEGEGLFLRAVTVALTSGKAPFIVTNGNDSGTGSLRWALANAAANPGPDTITFASVMNGATIALSTFTSPGSGNTAFDLTDTGGVTLDATALSAGVKIDGGLQNFRLFAAKSIEPAPANDYFCADVIRFSNCTPC